MTIEKLLGTLSSISESIVVSPEILGEGKPLTLQAGRPLEVTGVSLDSRAVKPGHMFFAVFGTYTDGHDYIENALDNGASVIVAERETDSAARCREQGVPYFVAKNIRGAVARIAAELHDHPSLSVHSIAVTGTNGKTSVAWLLASLYRELEGSAALIGTLGTAIIRPGEKPNFETLQTTTPSAIELQQCLADARDAGVAYAAVEATSQGLVQQRTQDVNWDGALFTNLSRDHMDLHQTMENYKASKKLLFSDELLQSKKKDKLAVLNADDEVGLEFAAFLREQGDEDVTVMTYSSKGAEADALIAESKPSLRGTNLKVKIGSDLLELETGLVGEYNISNVLAAVTYLYSRGVAAEAIAAALKKVTTVPGRLERVGDSDVSVFVDYAHTPDALINVQDSLLPLCEKRLITVFGCGGDRDRGKRPLMGKAVSERSQYAVATSDNPRTEDPDQIIENIIPGIKEGLESNASCEWKAITDRREAIEFAISEAEPGDVVLVAGKGHEPYQEVHGVKHDFDDREICRDVMKSRGLI